jgi:hypothetical protein
MLNSYFGHNKKNYRAFVLKISYMCVRKVQQLSEKCNICQNSPAFVSEKSSLNVGIFRPENLPHKGYGPALHITGSQILRQSF